MEARRVLMLLYHFFMDIYILATPAIIWWSAVLFELFIIVLLALKQGHSGITISMPWLLMPWFLANTFYVSYIKFKMTMVDIPQIHNTIFNKCANFDVPVIIHRYPSHDSLMKQYPFVHLSWSHWWWNTLSFILYFLKGRQIFIGSIPVYPNY